MNHSQLCTGYLKYIRHRRCQIYCSFILQYCSTNPLSDKKGFFYLLCKKLRVVQNSFPIATMLNKINVKKKSISTFECSTFYTTTLDKLLIKVLSEVISFVFKSKVRQHIGFFKNLSIGLLRVLEEDTLLSTLLSMLYRFSYK